MDGGARGVRAEMVAYKESNSGLSSVASWTVVGLLPLRAVERSAVSVFTRSKMFSCALRLTPMDMLLEVRVTDTVTCDLTGIWSLRIYMRSYLIIQEVRGRVYNIQNAVPRSWSGLLLVRRF